MSQSNYLREPPDPDRFLTRSIVLTEKAREYLRRRRLLVWLYHGTGSEITAQARVELYRQISWKKWTAYSLGSTEFPRGVTIYGDPGPKRDCSICWREHGDEIQHLGE